MDNNRTFKRRYACWEIVIGDRDIDVTLDGVIVAVHSQDDLKSVASGIGQKVEQTILAMRENNASRITLQTSWQ